MTLPLGSKGVTTKPNKKRLIETSNQLVEGWAGVGIMIGIWAVTFGIVASGIIKL
jgi:hypothetical protein